MNSNATAASMLLHCDQRGFAMRAGVRLQMIHRRSLKLTATLAVSCAACAAAVHAQAPSTTAQPSISGQQEAAPLAVQAQTPAISEDELKQQFLGKTFYLRGGYLDNTLHFDEKGRLDGALGGSEQEMIVERNLHWLGPVRCFTLNACT